MTSGPIELVTRDEFDAFALLALALGLVQGAVFGASVALALTGSSWWFVPAAAVAATSFGMVAAAWDDYRRHR